MMLANSTSFSDVLYIFLGLKFKQFVGLLLHNPPEFVQIGIDIRACEIASKSAPEIQGIQKTLVSRQSKRFARQRFLKKNWWKRQPIGTQRTIFNDNCSFPNFGHSQMRLRARRGFVFFAFPVFWPY